MIKTLIDTQNKTVTVLEEFLIDELMQVLQQHNAWDYKIIIQKDINYYPYYPYNPSQPVIQPYSYPWSTGIIWCGDTSGSISSISSISTNTAILKGNENITFTK